MIISSGDRLGLAPSVAYSRLSHARPFQRSLLDVCPLMRAHALTPGIEPGIFRVAIIHQALDRLRQAHRRQCCTLNPADGAVILWQLFSNANRRGP